MTFDALAGKVGASIVGVLYFGGAAVATTAGFLPFFNVGADDPGVSMAQGAAQITYHAADPALAPVSLIVGITGLVGAVAGAIIQVYNVYAGRQEKREAQARIDAEKDQARKDKIAAEERDRAERQANRDGQLSAAFREIGELREHISINRDWIRQVASRKDGDPLPDIPMVMPKVLLVEDMANAIDSMAAILRMHGFDVSKAGTVAEAIRLLDGWPESVILDMTLPDGDGLEVLERIQRDGRPIRVSVATGLAEIDSRVIRARKLLPNSVYIKPISKDMLLSMVGMSPAVSAAFRPEPARVPPEPAPAPNPPPGGPDAERPNP